MSKRVSIAMALALVCAQAFAQQITRVAVIDLQKVYMTYYKDSQAVRSFEEEKLAVQDHIKKLGDEIKDLQKKRLEVLSSGDAAALKAFDDAFIRKVQYLSDYIKVKQAELDAKAEALSKNDAFAQTLYKAIQSIAEMEGFSLVISSREANSVGSSVIWFSPMIDVSDKVIQALLGS